MRVRIAMSCLVLCTAAAVSSCGTGDEETASGCVPGEVRACPCLGDGDGVQECLEDNAYGECLCPGSVDAAPAALDAAPAPDAAGTPAVDAGSADAAEKVCIGNFHVTTSLELEAVSACTEIRGLLSISGELLTDVTLPVLRRVTHILDTAAGNGVSVSLPNATGIRFPALEEVVAASEDLAAGDVVVTTSATSTVEFPRLRTVGGSLELQAHVGTGGLDFPELILVGSDLLVRYVSGGQLSAPNLETVGGSLQIAFNPGINACNFDALTSVGANFTINFNDTLAQINFSSLSELGATVIQIGANPLLPTCQAENLVDQLQSAGWTGTVNVSGNGDGSCP